MDVGVEGGCKKASRTAYMLFFSDYPFVFTVEFVVMVVPFVRFTRTLREGKSGIMKDRTHFLI